MDDALQDLWEKSKDIKMTPEERREQLIRHVAATGNMSDPRITVETTRAVFTLMDAEKQDIA